MIHFLIVRIISRVDRGREEKEEGQKIAHIDGAGNHEVRCLKLVGKKLHAALNYRLRVRWAVSGAGAVHGAETLPERLNAGHYRVQSRPALGLQLSFSRLRLTEINSRPDARIT